MKLKIILSLLLLIGFSMAALAEFPFTSKSNGYDWNRATRAQKIEYCQLMAKSNSEIAPNITTDIIYDSLEAFYTSKDNAILSQPIVQMVALTVAAVANK